MSASMRFGPFNLEDGPFLVVAEIGVNHNGDRRLGIRQLRAAAAAGAHAVKFQSFRAEEVAAASAPVAAYQDPNARGSQREMLQELELKLTDMSAYREEALRLGVVAFSTPFDPESARDLAGIGVELMKVASGEITNHELIAAVARTGLPTMLSTGMSTLNEVAAAVEVFRANGGGALVLLHCVSAYPAPLEQMNLRAIQTMRDRFSVPIGLSDHTIGRDAAVAAVALGAVVVEKHFSIDRSLPGPDHSMSMEPAEFASMVDVLQRLRAGLGDARKLPVAAEEELLVVARRSIVAARRLTAGTRLTRSDLAVKRPGSGLSPVKISMVIGKRVTRDIGPDEPIMHDDLIE